jgi:hypothetical protein
MPDSSILLVAATILQHSFRCANYDLYCNVIILYAIVLR